MKKSKQNQSVNNPFNIHYNLGRIYTDNQDNTWIYMVHGNQLFLLEYDKYPEGKAMFIKQMLRGEALAKQSKAISQTAFDNPLKVKANGYGVELHPDEVRETAAGNYYCKFGKHHFVVDRHGKVMKSKVSRKEWEEKALLGNKSAIMLPLNHIWSVFHRRSKSKE